MRRHPKIRTFSKGQEQKREEKQSERGLEEATLAAGWMFGITAMALLFQLKWGPILVLWIITAIFLPGFYRNRNRKRYERKRFVDLNIYMEQMLYSFWKQKKILPALEDVQGLFREGKMRQTLERAREKILYDMQEEYPQRAGLEVIEQEYGCQRLFAMHRFLLKVEEIGGDFSESVELLRMDRAMWEQRVLELQAEREKHKRNIAASIFLSAGICLSTIYFMPKEQSIALHPIVQWSATLLLVCSIWNYYLAEKKLVTDWLKEERPKKEKNWRVQYQRFMEYDARKEQKKSMIWAALPLIVTVVGVWKRNNWMWAIGGLLFVFFFQQHRVGHYLNRRLLQREIEKVFPQWLMEVALRLQGENVQVAIQKTVEEAPELLKLPLQELVEKLEKEPESARPYQEFLQELDLLEIQSAMKMLYAIENGQGGDAAQQIKEIIQRNTLLMDQAEKLLNEDKMAAVGMFFLLPMLTGALKLIGDLSVFLVLFLRTTS